MKLVSWNVNGLRSCLTKGFLEYVKQEDPDIVCLQETKLQPEQAVFELEGYHRYFHSADKKGYSGTAVLTKEEPLSVVYGFGDDVHRHEGRVITAEYPEFYLVCCYTPNSQDGLKRLDYRMQWEDDLRAYLLELDGKKPVIYCGDLKGTPAGCKSNIKRKPVIFCGDLNVAYSALDIANPDRNHFNPGFSDQERGKFGELLDAGFVDSFRYLHPDERQYSWWSYRFRARERNIGWRIDYFLVSDFAADKINAAEIRTEVYGSDHCPIVLDIDL